VVHFYGRNQLEKIETKLKEANAMQEKYMEAFEQNIFPVSILQERLQKLAKSKNDLEQKKNEHSVQLSSSDSKVIPPCVVRYLLELYVKLFEQSQEKRKSSFFSFY
jgi:site-specific DNA recombinase